MLSRLTNAVGSFLRGKSFAKRFKKIKRIVICAGGTGGHIFPAVKLARDLAFMRREVTLIVDHRFRAYEEFLKTIPDFYTHELIRIKYLSVSPPSASKIKFLLTAPFHLAQSLILLLSFNSHKVIGFGGYVSFFPILAAAILRRQILLHEQNSVIGTVNRIFLPISYKLLTTFPETKGIKSKYQGKVICTGIPSLHLKTDEINKPSMSPITRSAKNVNIVITGGSQASESLDKITIGAIARFAGLYPDTQFTLHQQLKKENIDQAKHAYRSLKNLTHHVSSFHENMGELLSSATFAITRAGASSIVDAATHALPAIIIPMPRSKNNHQYENAKFMVNKNSAIMLEEARVSEEKLLAIMSNLVSSQTFYSIIATNSVSIFQMKPTRNIINLILLTDMFYLGLTHFSQNKMISSSPKTTKTASKS